MDASKSIVDIIKSKMDIVKDELDVNHLGLKNLRC